MDELNSGERQVAPTRDGIRRDHVARYEWAVSKLQGRKSIIDAACGVGYGAQLLAERTGALVHAIDKSADALHYAAGHYPHDNVVLHVADLQKALPKVKAAAAVCFETIEHLADPLPLLRDLCQAAPELLASVPNETVFPHGGRIKFHHRHYTREQFQALLEAAGYEVIEWHGQAGPESDVWSGFQGGRTLIAMARRREVGLHPPVETVAASPEPKPDTPARVAIVGLGPSCNTFFEVTRRLGGVSAYVDEVWGINAIGDVLRCDRVFHMDDLLIQEARAKDRPDSNIAAMVEWLKRHPGPVYTSVVRPGYPGLVAFPLEDVLNGGYDSNGGAPYFNSTAAYAIAYAVHIGVRQLSLFGLDYTLANAHNAEKGRACCEFWLGIAAARGMEITIPESSSLLDACEKAEDRLYGYDCVNVSLADREGGGVKVQFTDRARIPTAAEIEARYDHTRHPNPLVASERKS